MWILAAGKILQEEHLSHARESWKYWDTLWSPSNCFTPEVGQPLGHLAHALKHQPHPQKGQVQLTCWRGTNDYQEKMHVRQLALGELGNRNIQ